MSRDNDLDFGVTIRGFAEGQVVFGRYTLVRALGRGGMGVVWLARDRDLERDVALKFLPELVATDPVAIDDLKRETRRSLELTHPHIVRVHDFVQGDGLGAISMEFVAGRTLAELRLERPTRAFEVTDLTVWARQIADALHYAHVHARVIHRDLKPANVMVDGRGRIKLTDFGIAATVSDTVTRVSRLASTGGTAAYASPQQLMGETPSPADDIYALGATFYELLTSKPPFYSGNLLLQVQNRVPPPLSERRQELGIAGAPIPSAWEETVAACLGKQPGDRPPSIEALAGRLGIGGVFPPPAPEPERGGASSWTQAATVVSRGAAADTAPSRPPPLPSPAPPPRITPPPPSPIRTAVGAAPAVDPASPPDAAADRPPSRPLRRRSPLRWVLAVLLLGAIGAAVWYGDVPNRFAAERAVKDGQRAVIESDWGAAVRSFKDALLRRPADADIRAQLEAAQAEWLGSLRAAVERADPTEALQALEAEAAKVGSQLIEPQAGELRRLLASARERQREIELDALRDSIDSALRKADDGDVAAATAELAALKQGGALEREIESARKSVAGRAARASAERLAAAVRSGRPDNLQSVLRAASANPEANLAAAASSLLAAGSPGPFLDTLRGAGVDLGSAPFDTLPLDVALVEAVRDRFGDAAATGKFLADRYMESSARFLDNNLPGFALYAAERAAAEGGPGNTRVEQEARQALTYEFDLTLYLSPTRQDERNRGAGVPAEPVRGALREVVERRTSGWISLVEMDPLGAREAIALDTRISTVERSDDARRERATARYQTGVRTERNPDYDRITNELAQARKEASDLESQVAQIERGGDSKGEAVLRGIVGFTLRMNAARARQHADDLAKELASTPREVRTPTWGEEPYERITHRVTYATSLEATPNLNGAAVGPTLVWRADTTHEAEEVVGNASRGVPVKQAAYPAMTAVAATLGSGLADQVKRDNERLLKALQAATYAKLDGDLRGAAAGPAAVADRRWGLAKLWQASGIPVPQANELEQAVRGQIGLPTASPAGTPATTRSGAAAFDRRASAAVAPDARKAEGTEAPSDGYRTYIVRPGDTILEIARRLGVTPAELQAANQGLNLRRLRPGRILVVPGNASGGK